MFLLWRELCSDLISRISKSVESCGIRPSLWSQYLLFCACSFGFSHIVSIGLQLLLYVMECFSSTPSTSSSLSQIRISQKGPLYTPYLILQSALSPNPYTSGPFYLIFFNLPPFLLALTTLWYMVYLLCFFCFVFPFVHWYDQVHRA